MRTFVPLTAIATASATAIVVLAPPAGVYPASIAIGYVIGALGTIAGQVLVTAPVTIADG
ncbi:hypothetical protein [Nocardia sp. IFM 10818]